MKILTACVGFTLCLFLTISSGMAQPALKFCAYPSKSPKFIAVTYGPLVKYLSEQIGIPIKLVTAPDRETFQIRALNEEYDLALPCTACYFELLDKTGYYAIARGEPSFTGGVFVKKDSSITRPEQLLQGKRIAAVKQYSYAGFLFWYEYLIDKDLLNQFTSSSVFLENQDSIAYAILNSKVDAGVIRTDALKTYKLTALKDQFRIILESREIPHFPFVASAKLDKDLVQKIRASLTSLSIDTPEGKKLFQAMGVKRIAAVSDADYDAFRQSYHKAFQAWKENNK
ncbi:MAG: phosphate/phosphite/phosphonate ABC transporter substrate-binding protein [Proteobacteria bacterium]|nr:phosphate/phosphite/phosphonate ABC transporter substrate-binding protein [Pseudomonadota bacterium]